MTKLIRRQALRLILVSMLVGGLGAFNPSTFADEGIVLESGGGVTCPTVAGCGNWGCHANNGVQTCVLFNLEGSTHCTGTRTCN